MRSQDPKADQATGQGKKRFMHESGALLKRMRKGVRNSECGSQVSWPRNPIPEPSKFAGFKVFRPNRRNLLSNLAA
ncbi:MAG: hypothetical protein JWR19_4170 [Pedosphaera sp.]|nr:hypothetical protein [Pedosphaera sp.]